MQNSQDKSATAEPDLGPAPLNEVLTAELDHIHRHRHPADPGVVVARSLIGLALSGGGIRSATTNLGVLQALSRMEILPMVDYLSTVSGGGYIGAALSSLLSWNGANAPGPPGSSAPFTFGTGRSPVFSTRWQSFPFRAELDKGGKRHGSLGAELVAHLRTHGNFLVARWGVLRRETMRSIGNLVTGIAFSVLISTLTLFAASAAYVAIVHFGVPGIDHVLADPAQRPGWPDRLARPMADSVFSVLHVRKGPCPGGDSACARETTTTLTPPTLIGRIGRNAELLGGVLIGSARNPGTGNFWPKWIPGPYWPLAAGATAGVVCILILFGRIWLTWAPYFRNVTPPQAEPEPGESAEDKFERRLLWKVAGGLAIVVVACSLLSYPVIRQLQGSELLVGLLVPFAILFGARLASAFIGVVVLPATPLWTRRMRSVWGGVQAITMYGAWSLLLLGLLPLAVYAIRDHTGDIGIGALGSLLVTRLLTKGGGQGQGRFALPPELRNALLGIAVTLVVLLGFLYFAGLISRGSPPGLSALVIAIVTGVILLFFALTVDHNRHSPHYFYRDRLAETYLRSELPDADRRQRLYRDAMEMPLSALHGEPGPARIDPWRNPAPYHLISAAINLAGSRDLTRKDRKSGYWLFSKLYCGSIHTGFRRTSDYRNDETKLARAIAISGAAASSAAGRETFFAQAFATVLFNIRLGHWMENPMHASSRKYGEQAIRRPLRQGFLWPWYLWREITMATVETSRLVNLSDGGHTGDNVGIYPLLQRRCKIIIACDAERDGNLTFGSFTEALRHAYVDMGIDVDIDLSLIRPDPVTGRSRSHSAVGRIHYPDREDQESFLIYLKNSLTGDEPEPIQNYKNDRPEFPHESTADQFFDDAQFESYRALGVHLAEHTFALWATSKWFPIVRDHHSATTFQEPVA
jgi:hypothetical protein